MKDILDQMIAAETKALRAELKAEKDRAEKAEAALAKAQAALNRLSEPATPTGTAELLRAWDQRLHSGNPVAGVPDMLDYLAVAAELEQLYQQNRALTAALAIKVDEIAKLMVDFSEPLRAPTQDELDAPQLPL